MLNEPKLHHYIPKCYSKNFINDDGYLYISDFWENGRIFQTKPNKAFTKKYMYSQPLYDKGCFSNSIENFLSNNVEAHWTPVFRKLSERHNINQNDWAIIVQFISSMLVRVPITFNAVIELLREYVIRNASHNLYNIPEEILKIYIEKVDGNKVFNINLIDLIESGVIDINIDPHRAIASMGYIAGNIKIFQPGISFNSPRILHNMTSIPFISSDNPVCYFEGDINSSQTIPYKIRKNTEFIFVFPLSSQMALVNGTYIKSSKMHIDVVDKNIVTNIKKIIFKFSYRYIFGENYNVLYTWRNYKDICPRPDYEQSLIYNEMVHRISYLFGRPKQIKNAWKYNIKR